MRTFCCRLSPTLAAVAIAVSLAACDSGTDSVHDNPRRVAFETARERVSTQLVDPDVVSVHVNLVDDGELAYEDRVARKEVDGLASSAVIEWERLAAALAYDAYLEDQGFRSLECTRVDVGDGCHYSACVGPNGGTSGCVECPADDADGLHAAGREGSSYERICADW